MNVYSRTLNRCLVPAHKVILSTLLFFCGCLAALSGETMPATIPSIVQPSVAGPQTGDTVVARWQDNKQAVFVLHFDDGCHSHVANAIPALAKYGIIGTFYICPGWPLYQKDEATWRKLIAETGMEVGDHTMSHKGAPDAAAYEKDVSDCAEYIRKNFPPSKSSPLVSYGKPGVAGKDWKISDAEHTAIRNKTQVVARIDHQNRVVGMFIKEIGGVRPVIQKALDTGGEGVLLFHGVGGDWLKADMPLFEEILALLNEHKNEFWFAGQIAEHKYKTERDGATVTSTVAPDSIRIILRSPTDPTLFDQPLTLLTRVPQDWTGCLVTQQGKTQEATATGGQLMYRALPGAGEIILQPKK